MDIEELRKELGEYLNQMTTWTSEDGAEAMGELASMNARASEIRHWLHGQQNRKFQVFRQNEVNDFLDTCEFQFRVYSRLETVRKNEITLARGFD